MIFRFHLPAAHTCTTDVSAPMEILFQPTASRMCSLAEASQYSHAILIEYVLKKKGRQLHDLTSTDEKVLK